jgi:hypothetical protein
MEHVERLERRGTYRLSGLEGKTGVMPWAAQLAIDHQTVLQWRA